MYALVSLVVCMVNMQHVCETVLPDYTHADGTPPTFFECLGVGGQDIARQWLREHPGYVLKKVGCSVSNDPQRTRERVQSPEA
jgi:hypothetical protein